MAKTSMVNRDIKREEAGQEVRRQARRAEGEDRQPDGFVRREDGSRDQAAEAAARRVAVPRPQPLRADRPLARRLRKFGLGRNKLREATMRGDVPGLRKASW